MKDQEDGFPPANLNSRGGANDPSSSGEVSSGQMKGAENQGLHSAPPEAAGERPRSLSMPFSSLPPRQAADGSSTGVVASGSGVSLSPAGAPSAVPEYTPVTVSSRPRAICREHGLARNNLGQCMRCEREKAARRSSIGWKVIFALMVISLVAGIVVAAMVTR